ncbi:hypothetical protein HYQ46_012785 [Verticillium longisporum]|nr:hypothetical protein HYQ46_012785 [Verticillium longisporum]
MQLRPGLCNADNPIRRLGSRANISQFALPTETTRSEHQSPLTRLLVWFGSALSILSHSPTHLGLDRHSSTNGTWSFARKLVKNRLAIDFWSTTRLTTDFFLIERGQRRGSFWSQEHACRVATHLGAVNPPTSRAGRSTIFNKNHRRSWWGRSKKVTESLNPSEATGLGPDSSLLDG